MVIGVAGVAGAGKDLFVETCISELAKRGKSSKRYALADSLKLEVRDWCLDQYEIDPLNCSREEKEKIREFLVFHGSHKRQQSSGRYWVEKLAPKIELEESQYDYAFISDVRYDEFERDEIHWAKQELGGALVHISQYEAKEVPDKRHWPKTKMGKVFLPPANSKESQNDPKLKKAADFSISWEKINNINKDKYVRDHVVKFVEWLAAR